LKSLKKLRKLQLIGTRCTEQGIQNLQQVNPELGVAF
jgi:coenzyme F420-reducing hydrogenase beta subunit